MASKDELKIRSFAIHSRYALFWLQLVCNGLIPDHEPDVFNPPINKQNNWNYMDIIVNLHFGGFFRWDAVYFLHIAEYGYTYENCLAFFPLFPMLIRLTANSVLFPLQFMMTYRSVLILSAFIINQMLFVKCAVVLYKLGKTILENDILAYKAALLFCINPASIFMSAGYSECLFTFLAFTGMQEFENHSKVSSATRFGFSSVTRSNGIVNLGFEIHNTAKRAVRKALSFFSSDHITAQLTIANVWWQLTEIFLPAVTYVVMSVIPFMIYQYFAYKWFCTPNNYTLPQHLAEYASTNEYHTVGIKFSSWCTDTLPLAYTAIQKNHWGVGFLQYYQMKQIPNFMLAVPVTVLSVLCAWSYYKQNKSTVKTLGVCSQMEVKKKGDCTTTDNAGLICERLLPYIFHLVFLTVFSWLFMHVQVTTRFLFSSTPVLYWFAAILVTTDVRLSPDINRWDVFARLSSASQSTDVETNSTESYRNIIVDQILDFKRQSLFVKLLFLYFLAYFLFGTLLFSNFLPWT